MHSRSRPLRTVTLVVALALLAALGGSVRAQDDADRIRKVEQAAEAMAREDVQPKAVAVLLGMLQKEARRGAKDPWETSTNVLSAVSDGLARTTNPEAADLVLRASERPDWALAHYAARSLGGMDAPGTLDRVAAALGDERNPHRRMGAAEGMRAFTAADDAERARAVELLGGALRDEQWEVRVAAAHGFAGQEHDDFVATLINHLKRTADGQWRTRAAVMEALGEMTGEDFGYSASSWVDWWRTKERGGDPDDVPAYHGIPVLSGRTAFVLDMSGSMMAELRDPRKPQVRTGGGRRPFRAKDLRELYDHWRTKTVTTRLEAAQRELIVVLCELPPDVEFAIIPYSDASRPWKDRLVEASEKNKLEACEEVAGLQPNGMTNLFDATSDAFRYRARRDAVVFEKNGNYLEFLGGVDTIFLLSDGAPNAGDLTDPPAILAELTKAADLRKVVIHTIMMGGPSPFMADIAAGTGGRHVVID